MLSPAGAVAFLSRSQPCELEEAANSVSAAGDMDGSQSLGNSNINKRAQNVDDVEEQENPQQLYTSCCHLLLASPSQGIYNDFFGIGWRRLRLKRLNYHPMRQASCHQEFLERQLWLSFGKVRFCGFCNL